LFAGRGSITDPTGGAHSAPQILLLVARWWLLLPNNPAPQPSDKQASVFVTLDLKQTTNPFNGPLSGTTWVSRYQKGKTNLDFTGARDSEWQWHQLGHMQVCTSLQTDNHTSTPPLSFFTGWMPFLPPNQQRQSTVGVL